VRHVVYFARRIERHAIEKSGELLRADAAGLECDHAVKAVQAMVADVERDAVEPRRAARFLPIEIAQHPGDRLDERVRRFERSERCRRKRRGLQRRERASVGARPRGDRIDGVTVRELERAVERRIDVARSIRMRGDAERALDGIERTVAARKHDAARVKAYVGMRIRALERGELRRQPGARGERIVGDADRDDGTIDRDVRRAAGAFDRRVRRIEPHGRRVRSDL